MRILIHWTRLLHTKRRVKTTRPRIMVNPMIFPPFQLTKSQRKGMIRHLRSFARTLQIGHQSHEKTYPQDNANASPSASPPHPAPYPAPPSSAPHSHHQTPKHRVRTVSHFLHPYRRRRRRKRRRQPPHQHHADLLSTEHLTAPPATHPMGNLMNNHHRAAHLTKTSRSTIPPTNTPIPRIEAAAFALPPA